MIAISWFVWLLAVIILNIIFMNFIIAVISESYENVMQSLAEESFQVRANLIAERELHLNPRVFLDRKLFPRYLVVRKPTVNAHSH